MRSLADAQAGFARALAGDASALADLAVAPGGGAAAVAERIAIYRANGRANYRNALAATYPVVKRLTGAPFFDAAVDAFVEAHPPVAGDLNVYGENFAGFLAAYPPAATLPYLPDMARLEWAIDEASRAPDAPRMPDAVLAALAQVAADRLPAVRLRLDPSCRLTTSHFPALRIWRANQPDRDGLEAIDLDEGGVALVVRRDAQGIAIEATGAGDHAWLAALSRGATLGDALDAAQAADAAFDLGAALRAHIAAGTIAAVVDR